MLCKLSMSYFFSIIISQTGQKLSRVDKHPQENGPVVNPGYITSAQLNVIRQQSTTRSVSTRIFVCWFARVSLLTVHLDFKVKVGFYLKKNVLVVRNKILLGVKKAKISLQMPKSVWSCDMSVDREFYMQYGWMDVSGWSSTHARLPQDGPNVHHGWSLMSQSLIFVFVLGSRTKQFLCCVYLVKIVWSYRHYS
jgi:hypothetical protein